MRILPGIGLVLAGFLMATKPAPVFRIIGLDYRFQVSGRARAGLLHLRLVNHGTDLHEAMLVRFTGEHGSAAAYVDSVRADVEFPAFAEDIGGPGLTPPGDSTDVWLQLAPGRYAVVCWKGDHLRRGMAHDLEVLPAGGGNARAPDADITLGLVEYAYGLEGPLVAGRHVIRVRNSGRQPHEADLFRLADGRKPGDYIAWLDAGERGQPPVVPVGGVGDLVPGREVWLGVTLRPGRYFFICQVPDAKDGRPHHRHGMVREFEVR